jgi:hypothetical protein
MSLGPVSVRHAVTECQASAAATIPDQQGKLGQAWMATRLAKAAHWQSDRGTEIKSLLLAETKSPLARVRV